MGAKDQVPLNGNKLQPQTQTKILGETGVPNSRGLGRAREGSSELCLGRDS